MSNSSRALDTLMESGMRSCERRPPIAPARPAAAPNLPTPPLPVVLFHRHRVESLGDLLHCRRLPRTLASARRRGPHPQARTRLRNRRSQDLRLPHLRVGRRGPKGHSGSGRSCAISLRRLRFDGGATCADRSRPDTAPAAMNIKTAETIDAANPRQRRAIATASPASA